MASKLLPFGVSCDPATVIVQRDNQYCERTTSEYTSSGSNVVSSGASTLLNPAADVSSRSSETTATEMIPHGSELNKSAKVKLIIVIPMLKSTRVIQLVIN